MAAITDKLTSAVARWSGKIGSGGVAGATTTTIPLSSATNLTDGEVYFFTINRVNSSGNENTLVEMETVKGLLSGSNFISCVRGEEGTAQAWAAGTVVEILFTAAQWNSMKSFMNVEHNDDGTHKDTLVTTLKATGIEINTGTEDAKIVTPKAIADSSLATETYADTKRPKAPTIYDNGNSGTSKDIDWSNGDSQKLTLTGNVTLTFSNVSAGNYLTLWLIQDSTGSRTVTFPSGTKYSDGTAPTLTTTASAKDIIGIRAYSDSEYHVVASSLNLS